MQTSTLVLLFGCVTVTVLGDQSFQYCSNYDDSNSNCMTSVFRSSVDLTDFTSRCKYTSAITLNNLLWRIKFCYVNSNVVAYLEASTDLVSNTNWTSDAKATIKLLPKVGGYDRVIIKSLPNERYSRSNPSSNGVVLMSWNDYVTYFLNNNNEGSFEIEISTKAVSPQTPSPGLNQISTKLQIMLDNINELSEFSSAVVVVQGVKWVVKVRKSFQYLSLYLVAADEEAFRMGTAYNVNGIFKLLSYNYNSSTAISKRFSHEYSWGSNHGGFDDFLPWSVFTDPNSKYVMMNKARILVQFSVAEPQTPSWDTDTDTDTDFDKPQKCFVCSNQFQMNGVHFPRCGHVVCNTCYANQPTMNCRCGQ